MAFRFSLESILKHRKREEEIAQKEFMEQQTIVETCLRHLEELYLQIDRTRELISASVKSGTPEDLHRIRSSEEFIEGQKIRIHNERKRARELIRELEERQEILLSRLHERKIMEKLKEKKFEEYKVLMAQMEMREMDDLVNVRWKPKGGQDGSGV